MKRSNRIIFSADRHSEKDSVSGSLSRHKVNSIVTVFFLTNSIENST